MAAESKTLNEMNTEFLLAVQQYPQEEQQRLMRQYTDLMQSDAHAARSLTKAICMSGPER